MTNTDYRILIIDTDNEIIESVQNFLKSEGYSVLSATKSREAIQLAQAAKPHLIIVEMLMPELDGIDICIELRTNPDLINSLIVFYTGRDEDYSQIAAFNAGADDYIIKPVKHRVLSTRIKALLKRHPINQEKIIKNDTIGLTIDRDRYLVFLDGKEIIFPRKEFELLALLSAAPRKVFTRKEISQLIWGYEFIAKNRTIDVHILKIREKLGGRYVKTIKGVGYCLEG
ncbi:MAG: response regulator transcription factor [Bacteroidia bacterium]|jgi:two-component system alkaline phosphatase synthesis response regulator PhoP